MNLKGIKHSIQRSKKRQEYSFVFGIFSKHKTKTYGFVASSRNSSFCVFCTSHTFAIVVFFFPSWSVLVIKWSYPPNSHRSMSCRNWYKYRQHFVPEQFQSKHLVWIRQSLIQKDDPKIATSHCVSRLKFMDIQNCTIVVWAIIVFFFFFFFFVPIFSFERVTYIFHIL
jgi:hypothetical protein